MFPINASANGPLVTKYPEVSVCKSIGLFEIGVSSREFKIASISATT